jgi:hypothetical protein
MSIREALGAPGGDDGALRGRLRKLADDDQGSWFVMKPATMVSGADTGQMRLTVRCPTKRWRSRWERRASSSSTLGTRTTAQMRRSARSVAMRARAEARGQRSGRSSHDGPGASPWILAESRTRHPMPSFKGLLFAQGIRDIEPKLRQTGIDFAALITAEGHRLPQRLRINPEDSHPKLRTCPTHSRLRRWPPGNLDQPCARCTRDGQAENGETAAQPNRELARLTPEPVIYLSATKYRDRS